MSKRSLEDSSTDEGVGEKRKQESQQSAATPCNGGVVPAVNGYHPRTIASPEMCYYCFEVLIAHLTHSPSPKTPHFINDEFPLFVTWKTSRDRKLRGCMGTFTPRKLHRGLSEYSLTSALRDNRFKPIAADEIPKLECGISLLTNFEKGANYLDWEIGIHGIQIEFQDGKHTRTATYLPEVAREQGWTKPQTIDSLMRKGGYKHQVTNEMRSRVKLTRYQSEKCVATYDDFIRSQRRHRPY